MQLTYLSGESGVLNRLIMNFEHPEVEDISSFCRIKEDEHMPNQAKFYEVDSFTNLVKIVAHLHFSNRKRLLLYRGQNKLYLNKNKQYSFYPSIFRGTDENSNLQSNEYKERYKKLEKAESLLKDKFPSKYLPAKTLQPSLFYSIIQHYNLASTPFLDLTHSLQVAYSFGCEGVSNQCYIAVFGFPHLKGRQILYKCKPNLINVPLLYHCLPNILRPHFQEAYSIGLNILTDSHRDKSRHDWKKNLVAIIKIPVEDTYRLTEDYLQLNEKPDFIKEVGNNLQ